MAPRLTHSFAAAATIALFAAAAPSTIESQAARPVVRLMTGTPGAGFYPLGEALARAFAASQSGWSIQVQESTGSVSNVTALERGDADIGFAYADVAYMAFVGRLEPGAKPFERLRGVAVLELTPVHLVVRGNSGLTSVGDLRGHRIGVGTPGSGTALTAGLVLKAAGLDPPSVRAEPLRYNDAAARIVNGTLDAMFVTGSQPVEAVSAAMRAGARLLPLTGPAIERLRHDYPFLRPTVIRSGTYSGQQAAVHTVGVENVLVCRRELDERLVHDLTRRFFQGLSSLPYLRSLLRLMDLEQAPATPIPLHEGAARYYRERELSR
jgi:TRAP transporter TAXI family solute receptor